MGPDLCLCTGQMACQKVVWVDDGQRWAVGSCGMAAMLYTVEKFTLSSARVFLLQLGSTAPCVAKTSGVLLSTLKCDMLIPQLLFLLSFMPLRVFQR